MLKGNTHVRGNRSHIASGNKVTSFTEAAKGSADADVDNKGKKYTRRRRRPREWAFIVIALALSVTIVWRLLKMEQDHADLALATEQKDLPLRNEILPISQSLKSAAGAEKQEAKRVEAKVPTAVAEDKKQHQVAVAAASIDKNKNENSECGLYLALSTLPGAGLGIFSSVERKAGDAVGSGDVCLPNIDLQYHNRRPVFDSMHDYYWQGAAMGMSRESHSNDVNAYCPGLDCAINCHLGLLNTHHSFPRYDYAGLHRSRDPGAGAITPYHNGTTYATRTIPAGGELFKNYGDHYFVSRHTKFGPDFPLVGDYPMAEHILRNMTAIKMSPIAQKDLYEDIVLGMKKRYNTSRVLGAFPLNIKGALVGAEQNLFTLLQPTATRSIEWLRENGRCIDNMKPVSSNIRQAGRGAVATRALKKDQRITTSPLHHVPYSSFMFMHNFKFAPDENGDMARWAEGLKGYQILMNYCYGHPKSSMLLCPYGNGVNYINHNQTQANVRFEWADDFFRHNSTLVEKGVIEDLMWNTKPQLAFDYVALRDIEPDEELFMDYGDVFEQDWRLHVDHFKPAVPNADSYVDGISLNLEHPNLAFKTEKEQESNPYPDHLQIRAHGMLEVKEEIKEGMYYWGIIDYGLPAKVLERFVNGTEHYYTIQLGIISQEAKVDMGSRDREANVTWVHRYKVPRSAIAFYDKPGRTDIHLPNAFRHVIGIPDDIFPDQWKNADQLAQVLHTQEREVKRMAEGFVKQDVI
jgi:hypothetical protein